MAPGREHGAVIDAVQGAGGETGAVNNCMGRGCGGLGNVGEDAAGEEDVMLAASVFEWLIRSV